LNVADLVPDGADALGFTIVCIYARKPPEYAVYRTNQRILVHFADDLAKSDEQRKLLSQLAPVRGEINGLIDGWRLAPDSNRALFLTISNGAKLRSKAERYDRRSADAIQVALEGDCTGAASLLEIVKQDILNERIGWSRFEYLIVAFMTAIAVGLIALFAMLLDSNQPCASSANRILCLDQAVDLWRGFIAGATGAFFSIALGIRGRTILTDLYRPANLMDAALRVVVGSIGGVVLVALILAGFVRFSLGDNSPGTYDTIHILIVGFIAGFTERLVPDLLAKAEVRTGETAVIRRPEPATETKPQRDPNDGGSSELALQAAEQTAEAAFEQAGEDVCVAELQIPDDELTRDEDLPAASGGIDKAQGAE
jgi:hypothetical protein